MPQLKGMGLAGSPPNVPNSEKDSVSASHPALRVVVMFGVWFRGLGSRVFGV